MKAGVLIEMPLKILINAWLMCLSLSLQTCFSMLRLLLQVSTEAFCRDSDMVMTFGCSLKDCRHLLQRAKELGVQVVGVR